MAQANNEVELGLIVDKIMQELMDKKTIIEMTEENPNQDYLVDSNIMERFIASVCKIDLETRAFDITTRALCLVHALLDVLNLQTEELGCDYWDTPYAGAVRHQKNLLISAIEEKLGKKLKDSFELDVLQAYCRVYPEKKQMYEKYMVPKGLAEMDPAEMDPAEMDPTKKDDEPVEMAEVEHVGRKLKRF